MTSLLHDESTIEQLLIMILLILCIQVCISSPPPSVEPLPAGAPISGWQAIETSKTGKISTCFEYSRMGCFYPLKQQPRLPSNSSQIGISQGSMNYTLLPSTDYLTGYDIEYAKIMFSMVTGRNDFPLGIKPLIFTSSLSPSSFPNVFGMINGISNIKAYSSCSTYMNLVYTRSYPLILTQSSSDYVPYSRYPVVYDQFLVWPPIMACSIRFINDLCGCTIWVNEGSYFHNTLLIINNGVCASNITKIILSGDTNRYINDGAVSCRSTGTESSPCLVYGGLPQTSNGRCIDISQLNSTIRKAFPLSINWGCEQSILLGGSAYPQSIFIHNSTLSYGPYWKSLINDAVTLMNDLNLDDITSYTGGWLYKKWYQITYKRPPPSFTQQFGTNAMVYQQCQNGNDYNIICITSPSLPCPSDFMNPLST